MYETDFKRPDEGQLYKTYLFKDKCPPLQDILEGNYYKNPDKKLYNVKLHKFTPQSKEDFCKQYPGQVDNPNSICYKEEKSQQIQARESLVNPAYVEGISVVGGKKRKRKTLRKGKKSKKTTRKHKKTAKKHAKRHSKTMKRKGKQHHKRSKTQRKKSRK